MYSKKDNFTIFVADSRKKSFLGRIALSINLNSTIIRVTKHFTPNHTKTININDESEIYQCPSVWA
jgi:hypothetical protein